MKKNDWLILAATTCYTLLFFQQAPGINHLLFSSVIIVCLSFQDTTEKKHWKFYLAAACCFLSGLSVTISGNALSIIANLASLGLLSGMAINPRSSVFASLLFSGYSVISSAIYMIVDYLDRRMLRVNKENKRSLQRLLTIWIPLIIGTIFLLLYRSSNPVFRQFTNQLDLSFISFPWILFTLGGLILVYGLMRHKSLDPLASFDREVSNQVNSEAKPLKIFGKSLLLTEENLSGITLLATLNVLLLVVNSLDLGYLFSGEIPVGMSYSQFVHEGTGALIFSIIAAIGIILVYFRGELNFYDKNGSLKALAYTWVIQNILIVASTAYRNYLYIEEYSLSYKRIGVYVFLLMAFIGLISTLVKIANLKSNYYLMRFNSACFYGVLLLASFVTWDQFITNENIQRHKSLNKSLDSFYLLTLSPAVLPTLIREEKTLKATLNNKEKIRFDRKLSGKIYRFMRKNQETDWRSFNLLENLAYKELTTLHTAGKLDSLNLSDRTYLDPAYLSQFSKLKHLDLSLTPLPQRLNLPSSNSLTSLVINGNDQIAIKDLPELPRIKELTLRNNNLTGLDGISKYPTLLKLDLRGNNVLSLVGVEALTKLEVLDISLNTNAIDLHPLHQLSGLKILYISRANVSGVNDLRFAIPGIKVLLVK